MKGIDTIASNARRLLADAELLFADRRYPTAVTLSIMTIEEAGKYVSFSHGKDLQSRSSHKMKQGYLGQWFWLWGIYEVFTAEFEEFCTYLRQRGDAENLKYLASLDVCERIDYMKRLYFMDSDDVAGSVETYVRSKFKYAEKLNMLMDAFSGKVERTRQCGIYADVGSNGDVTNDPHSIQKTEAEEWLENARVAIEFMGMFQRKVDDDLANGSN
jgi:hypothetical protein